MRINVNPNRLQRFFWLSAALAGVLTMIPLQEVFSQSRDEKVRLDRENLTQDKSWYYDDLDRAMEVAASNNKPLMVVLRCIP